MTREEMEKKYFEDMKEGSADIIVNPDGSTITIPAKKNDMTMDEYGDTIKTVSKITEESLSDSFELIRLYGMILAYTKTVNHASIEIGLIQEKIKVLEAKK
tara:strand:+ start:1576 stop:1878 length:303 start_codon:yes stop_codon:yes gene_type:complete